MYGAVPLYRLQSRSFFPDLDGAEQQVDDPQGKGDPDGFGKGKKECSPGPAASKYPEGGLKDAVRGDAILELRDEGVQNIQPQIDGNKKGKGQSSQEKNTDGF